MEVGRSSSDVDERVDPLVNSIAASIEPMFDNVPPLSSGNCIYRVPERLRSVKPEAYTPLIVSIGPFHHGDARLKTMEHLKTLYLYFLLHRRPEISLNRYVKVLLELETRARNCYAETILYTKEEFVKMLLLDGCFLLELFRQYDDPTLRQNNDLLFKNHWVFNAVHRDVLLLENQIPFFVLETLCNGITPIGPSANYDLFRLTEVFLGHHKLTRVGFESHRHSSEEDQLLLSVLKRITNGNLEKATTEYKTTIHQGHPTSWTFIPSATELSRVGIIFQKSSSSYLFSVHFPGNGEFHIPSLVIDDRTEPFLRNLIALEQTHSQTTIIKDQNQSHSNQIPTISAYVTLMDCLVNTSTDVALLRRQGILHNQLGDDEEVAQFFNKLRTGIIMNADEFYFSKVFESVNVHYHKKWNEWRAIFFTEFWSTPWRKTSLLAAIFLLLCAFVQALCSIIQV